jgi:hypothetical protein
MNGLRRARQIARGRRSGERRVLVHRDDLDVAVEERIAQDDAADTTCERVSTEIAHKGCNTRTETRWKDIPISVSGPGARSGPAGGQTHPLMPTLTCERTNTRSVFRSRSHEAARLTAMSVGR